MKIGLPLDMNQVCPTIKANCYRASAANMDSSDHYPHGEVLVITEVSYEQEGLASAGSIQGNRIDTGANY